ncbi:MAG: DUF1801 domain-containing protein [Fulvivirga sp.]
MAELKTKENDASVKDFINTVEDEQKRKDCFRLIDMMQDITGEEAKMWGTSIVGFGTYHYKYDSGREGDFMTVGFSPRKQALTLYIMAGFSNYDDLMQRLGKFKTGKSCLYVKKLEDVDEKVLRELIKSSVKFIKDRYP